MPETSSTLLYDDLALWYLPYPPQQENRAPNVFLSQNHMEKYDLCGHGVRKTWGYGRPD